MSRFLIRWVSALTLLLSTFGSHGQTIHIAHCMTACPSGSSPANEIVVRHLYAASINAETGLADWVAYRILEDSVGVASLLRRWWQQDELLPGTAIIEEGVDRPGFTQPDLTDQPDRSYRINEIVFSSEERGRLVPLTSFADTPYWEELNNLTNMAPLPADLRTGSWARLEQAINELAATEGELFVVSGPIYEISAPLSIQANGYSEQASAFFKVVATRSHYAAFLFDHAVSGTANYCDHRSTLQQIQSRSGLTLFPDLLQMGSPDLAARLRCNSN
ncbi:MAG: DNA/RNA non-specific endonuclease [Proteobacteria bacterium]|nr:DNA/RNA non-specific endonuclease [Pseudomonadota bacterium]